MKTSPVLPPDAEEQAALWAARLDGSSLSAEDRDTLAAWLTADPAHRVLLSTYCQFSADLEQQLPLLAGIRDEVAESHTASKTTQLPPWLRRPLLAGVALTAAAAVAVVLWRGQSQNQFQNLATSVAQRQELTLADGTHVELNAQTALVVELQAEERRVRLARGEAFFHVSKDAARPFFVETPAGSVRVTGTQFNVRTEADGQLEVTVLEGSVQVRPGESPTPQSLHAGDQLVREQGARGCHDAFPRGPGRCPRLAAGPGDLQRHAVARGAGPLRPLSRAQSHRLGRGRAPAGGRPALARRPSTASCPISKRALPVRVTRGTDGSIRVDAIHR